MDARNILALDEALDSLDFVPQEVDSRKLASFNAQAPKKSRHEKEKEAAAKKAKEEEEEAAKAYEEFVAAFGVEEETSGGGGGGGGRGRSVKTAGKGFVRAGGGGYNPLQDKEAASSAPDPSSYTTKPPPSRSGGALVMDDDEPEVPVPKGPPGKKKRDMDKFLEELKRDQKDREDRLQYQAGRAGSSVTALAAKEHGAPALSGSYDTGDPLTTNIHVSNLPQNVTEQSLGMLFARYGPVGSVKIMWPRLDGPPVPGGRRILGGFVAFLRRGDAETAVKEIGGLDWGGSVLRTGWGKSVPLPSRPIYEVEGGSRGGSSSHRRRRSSSSGDDRPRRRDSRSRSRSPPRGHSKRQRRVSDDSRSRSRSRSPPRRAWPALEDGVDEKFLRTVAGKVREHGANFESVIRERERGNSKFAFFSDEKLPSFHFFRMLLDSHYVPPIVPNFSDEGNAETYSSDSAEESETERVRKGKLGRRALQRFESILRDLTSTREKIARAMAFALEHADAANIIVDILIASLTLDATPVPRKIARLHLVSDILHNSASLPHAWVYRSTFESRLTTVFDHLGDIYRSFPGRMKAEQFKIQVTNIVDVWERDWFVFEPRVIEDFKRRLSGESPTPVPSPPPPPPPSSDRAEAPSFEPHAQASSTTTGGGFKAAGSGFKAATFSTGGFQPSTLHAVLPDEEEEEEEEGGVEVGVEVDVDGEEVDVDGAPVPGGGGEGVETVVLLDADDDDGMDLAGSDEDMF